MLGSFDDVRRMDFAGLHQPALPAQAANEQGATCSTLMLAMFEKSMDKMGDFYSALADANMADGLNNINLVVELVTPCQIVAARGVLVSSAGGMVRAAGIWVLIEDSDDATRIKLLVATWAGQLGPGRPLGLCKISGGCRVQFSVLRPQSWGWIFKRTEIGKTGTFAQRCTFVTKLTGSSIRRAAAVLSRLQGWRS